jgi:hypothetical protein
LNRIDCRTGVEKSSWVPGSGLRFAVFMAYSGIMDVPGAKRVAISCCVFALFSALTLLTHE